MRCGGIDALTGKAVELQIAQGRITGIKHIETSAPCPIWRRGFSTSRSTATGATATAMKIYPRKPFIISSRPWMPPVRSTTFRPWLHSPMSGCLKIFKPLRGPSSGAKISARRLRAFTSRGPIFLPQTDLAAPMTRPTSGTRIWLNSTAGRRRLKD